MRNDLHDIEALEAYTEGRMQGDELHAFEQRLADDPDLADRLTKYSSTREAIKQHHEDQRVKELLKQTEANTMGRFSIWMRWAAAATALLLVGSAAWYMSRSSSDLPTLARSYAVPESALPVFMSSGSDARRTLDRSMQHFGAGEYTQALAQLEQLPRTDTTAFYAGICNELLGQDPAPHLQDVLDEQNSPYRARALYHLMLWHMKQDRRAEAFDLLQEQLGMKEHPYREELKALADKMKPAQ